MIPFLHILIFLVLVVGLIAYLVVEDARHRRKVQDFLNGPEYARQQRQLDAEMRRDYEANRAKARTSPKGHASSLHDGTDRDSRKDAP